MGRTRALHGLLLASSVCLFGCLRGPDYVRPQVAVPQDYRFALDPALRLAELPAWWRSFGDPTLDALVQEGLAANQDLRIATARVDEFAARLASSRAQGLPQVGYAAGASVAELSRDSLPPGADRSRESYSAVLSASWELDLWGRIRRENEAARANLLATEQARSGVALTLVAAIVGGYVTLLDLDRRLQIAQDTVKGRSESVELFRMRLEGGAVSEFEMMQVTAEYETAQAAIPDLERAIALQEHALSLLVGRNPGPIGRGTTLQTLAPPPIPGGLPSQLLERRPDILQSEQQLIAANALIGAARALYFPSVSLTGTGGTASAELDRLFSGGSRSWSFVGQVLGPIFAGGAIDAANRQAEARREQALAAYRQTIQNAFREVDDALATIRTNADLVATLERRVVALRRAVALSHDRYDNGYTDYLSVLDSERHLFSAELSLAAAQGDRHRALIALYRALGGDWSGTAPSAPASPAM